MEGQLAMKLVRLATLQFEDSESAILNKNSKLSVGDVSINLLQLNSPKTLSDRKKRLLIYSTISLDELPEKNSIGMVKIPELKRRKSEHAIEHVANIISITERCSRTISSPTPHIALVACDDNEKIWLSDCAGIHSTSLNINNPKVAIPIDSHILDTLTDRIDGVSLLAEALSSSHSGNRYREFIRIIECAFQSSTSGIDKKLNQFLQGANLGYTREEVKNWLSYRNGAIHANRKQTPTIIYESDVRVFIPRMEQAIYDVVFNKKVWGDTSSERIDKWMPSVATTNIEGDITLTAGEPMVLRNQVFDDFNVYPLDLNARLTVSQLPKEFWVKIPVSKTFQGKTTVRKKTKI